MSRGLSQNSLLSGAFLLLGACARVRAAGALLRRRSAREAQRLAGRLRRRRPPRAERRCGPVRPQHAAVHRLRAQAAHGLDAEGRQREVRRRRDVSTFRSARSSRRRSTTRCPSVRNGGKSPSRAPTTNRTTSPPASRRAASTCISVRLIETRVLVRREHGWDALPYVWNAAQTEAELARTGDALPLDLVGDDGTREPFTYVVPNENQCAGCHVVDVKAKAIAPIGPKARHLNRDFAYADGSENQLAHWSKLGYLTGAPAASAAPRNADWRDASAPIADRARAYLDINCAHCHNPAGPANTTALDLSISRADRPSPRAVQAAGRGRPRHRRSLLRHRARQAGRLDPAVPHGLARDRRDDARAGPQHHASRRTGTDPALDCIACQGLRAATDADTH